MPSLQGNKQFILSLTQLVNKQIIIWLTETAIPTSVSGARYRFIQDVLKRIILRHDVDKSMERPDVNIELWLSENDENCLVDLFNNPEYIDQVQVGAPNKDEAKKCFSDLINYWINYVLAVPKFDINNALYNANNFFDKDIEKKPIPSDKDVALEQHICIVGARADKSSGKHKEAVKQYEFYLNTLAEKSPNKQLSLIAILDAIRFFMDQEPLNNISHEDLWRYYQKIIALNGTAQTVRFALEHNFIIKTYKARYLLTFLSYYYQLAKLPENADKPIYRQKYEELLQSYQKLLQESAAHVSKNLIRKGEKTLRTFESLSLVLTKDTDLTELQMKVYELELAKQCFVDAYHGNVNCDRDPLKVHIMTLNDIKKMDDTSCQQYFSKNEKVKREARQQLTVVFNLLRTLMRMPVASNKFIFISKISVDNLIIVIQMMQRVWSNDSSFVMQAGLLIQNYSRNGALATISSDDKNVLTKLESSSNRKIILDSLCQCIRNNISLLIESGCIWEALQALIELEKWYYENCDDLDIFNVRMRGYELLTLIKLYVAIENNELILPGEVSELLKSNMPTFLSELLLLLEKFFNRYARDVQMPMFDHSSVMAKPTEFRQLWNFFIKHKKIVTAVVGKTAEQDAKILCLGALHQIDTGSFTDIIFFQVLRSLIRRCVTLNLPANNEHYLLLDRLVDKIGQTSPHIGLKQHMLYVFDMNCIFGVAMSQDSGMQLLFPKILQSILESLLRNPYAKIIFIVSNFDSSGLKISLNTILGNNVLEKISIYGHEYFLNEASASGKSELTYDDYKLQLVDKIRTHLALDAANVIYIYDNIHIFVNLTSAKYKYVFIPFDQENNCVVGDGGYLSVIPFVPTASTRWQESYSNAVRSYREQATNKTFDMTACLNAISEQHSNLVQEVEKYADKCAKYLVRERSPRQQHFLFYFAALNFYQAALNSYIQLADTLGVTRCYLSMAKVAVHMYRLNYPLYRPNAASLFTSKPDQIADRFDVHEFYFYRRMYCAYAIYNQVKSLKPGEFDNNNEVKLIVYDIRGLFMDVISNLQPWKEKKAEEAPNHIKRILTSFNLTTVSELVNLLESFLRRLQDDLILGEEKEVPKEEGRGFFQRLLS